jgi:hypothetical protein
MIGVGEIGPIDIRLPDEELLLVEAQRIPFRQILGPRRQPRILGHDAEPFLIGEDLLAHLVPALVEQMHVADLLDPLGRRMMRRVSGARHVIDEPRLAGRDLLQLFHILDGLVGHCRFEIPTGIVEKGIDRRRIAEQVRLPLARITADEAVEIIEAHSVRPLIERPGLARLIKRRVVVLAEPRGGIAVRLENGADRSLLDRNDGVVARETRRDLADDPEADGVMIASRDDRRSRRRAQ